MKSLRSFAFINWLLGTAGASALAVGLTLIVLNDDEVLPHLDMAASASQPPRHPRAIVDRVPSVLKVIERKMLEDANHPLWSDRAQNVLHKELGKLSEVDLFAALHYHDCYIHTAAQGEFEKRAERLSEAARSRLHRYIADGSKWSHTSIRTLAKSGSTGIDRLAPLLDHVDQRIALHVASVLLRSPHPLDLDLEQRALDTLLTAMINGYSSWDITSDLTARAHPQLLPRLRDLAQNRDLPSEVRARSAIVLTYQARAFEATTREDELPLLMSLLADEEEKVRSSMMYLLRFFPKSVEVTRIVRLRLKDTSGYARYQAASYLSENEPGFVKQPPTATDLARARHKLLDPSPSVNDSALYGVRKHKDVDAMAWLVRLLARETDQRGMLTYAQVRAGRLIAELTGKEFGEPQSRRTFERWETRQPNYGFNEVGGICGWGAPPLEWHVERGKRLGGEYGKRIAEEAQTQIENNACYSHASEHSRNQTYLAERERVLLWWENEGQWKYPPVIELAQE